MTRRAYGLRSLSLVIGLMISGGQEPAEAQDEVKGLTTLFQRMKPEVMEALRERAWRLFQDVREADLPHSQRWLQESDAFTDPTCSPAQTPQLWTAFNALELEESYEKTKGVDTPEGLAPPKDKLYESTFFNKQACLDIHRGKFPLSDDTTAERLKRVGHRHTIDEFSPGAKVIKTFWRALPLNNSEVDVGIWQWPTSRTPDRSATLTEEKWYLDTRAESDWPEEPVCVQLAPPAGSNCLKAEDHFPMAKVAKKDEFPCPDSCPPELFDGQSLILVAFHVIAKDSPDWLWATFWWKGETRPGKPSPRTTGEAWTCDNAQRPKIEGPWGNYSANVMENFTLAKPFIESEDDLNNCGAPGTIGTQMEESLAVYNPFVEGTLPDGRKSSCMVCHARASTRGDQQANRMFVPPVGVLEFPPATELDGHIRTDYLWTVREYIGSTRWPDPTTPPPTP